MGLGITEIILIFLVVLLFFGAKRLPEVARSMGKAMSEFKKAKDEVFSFPTQTDNEVSKTTGQQVIVKEDRLTTASRTDVAKSQAIDNSFRRLSQTPFLHQGQKRRWIFSNLHSLPVNHAKEFPFAISRNGT